MNITDYRTAKFKRTEKLLDQLAKIGSESYKEEWRDSVSRWEKIGMAIAHTGMTAGNAYELANTVAEDWNWHSMVSVVDFFLGREPRAYTIDHLKDGIDGEYALVDSGRKVRLTLTVEEID